MKSNSMDLLLSPHLIYSYLTNGLEIWFSQSLTLYHPSSKWTAFSSQIWASQQEKNLKSRALKEDLNLLHNLKNWMIK